MREREAGHELGDHLWSHTNASTQTYTELREEIERTAEAIQSAGDSKADAHPPYFSAPEAVADAAAGLGFSAVVLRSIGRAVRQLVPALLEQGL